MDQHEEVDYELAVDMTDMDDQHHLGYHAWSNDEDWAGVDSPTSGRYNIEVDSKPAEVADATNDYDGDLEWARGIQIEEEGAIEPKSESLLATSAAAATPLSNEEENFDDEKDEDESEDERSVVPIVCSQWLCLAMVVIFAIVIFPNIPSFNAATNYSKSQSSLTAESIFKNPKTLPPCEGEGACQKIVDSLTEVLSEDSLEQMKIPGTCQYGARDWLRVNKDILVFTPERIRQRFAMAMLYCETNGPAWLETTNWLSDLHECDWYNRVGTYDACDRDENILIIRLNENSLQGTLPKELSILTNLMELSVAGNLIHGSIPEEYSSLVLLDTLDVSFNFMVGDPSTLIFKKLNDLVYLNLSFNFFAFEIPDTFDKMPYLEHFFAESNKIYGSIPQSITQLKRLKKLNLGDNELTGTIPSNLLLNSSKLIMLHVHENQLSGEIPSSLFESSSHVKSINLGQNVNLHGTVSYGTCDLVRSNQVTFFEVDCESISCECCTCATAKKTPTSS